jgi:hypothetical protein
MSIPNFSASYRILFSGLLLPLLSALETLGAIFFDLRFGGMGYFLFPGLP